VVERGGVKRSRKLPDFREKFVELKRLAQDIR
jgi:hypothetical protein